VVPVREKRSIRPFIGRYHFPGPIHTKSRPKLGSKFDFEFPSVILDTPSVLPKPTMDGNFGITHEPESDELVAPTSNSGVDE
jgi:hypothetical protein